MPPSYRRLSRRTARSSSSTVSCLGASLSSIRTVRPSGPPAAWSTGRAAWAVRLYSSSSPSRPSSPPGGRRTAVPSPSPAAPPPRSLRRNRLKFPFRPFQRPGFIPGLPPHRGFGLPLPPGRLRGALPRFLLRRPYPFGLPGRGPWACRPVRPARHPGKRRGFPGRPAIRLPPFRPVRPFLPPKAPRRPLRRAGRTLSPVIPAPGEGRPPALLQQPVLLPEGRPIPRAIPRFRPASGDSGNLRLQLQLRPVAVAVRLLFHQLQQLLHPVNQRPRPLSAVHTAPSQTPG